MYSILRANMSEFWGKGWNMDDTRD